MKHDQYIDLNIKGDKFMHDVCFGQARVKFSFPEQCLMSSDESQLLYFSSLVSANQ